MSSHTSTASTRAFTDSAEVRRRVVEGTLSPNQPSYDASTQPFTDSAEVRRRAGVATPEPVPQPLQPTPDEPALQLATGPRQRPHSASLPQPSPTYPPHPPHSAPLPALSLAPAPLDFPVKELAEAFANASLATLPDARLVLACPAGSPLDGPNSVIIPLPGGIGGWDTVGIVQRTRDVDFVIDLPFWVQSTINPSQVTCEELKCRLYYDPTSDDCLLVNESPGHIYLTRLVPAGNDQPCLAQFDHYVVSPGVWRISIFEHTEFRQHLLNFYLLRRQFVVDISGAPPTIPSSSKHPASSNDEVVIKRRRLQGDVSEIRVSPVAIRPQHPFDTGAITTPDAPVAPYLSTNTPTLTRQISQPGITLLDLRNDEVAVVRTTQLKGTEMNTRTQAHITTLESYKLKRVGGIANTTASSVFFGQHCELPEPIVAKVIRYKGMSSSDLVKCAGKWRTEKEILDRLRHRSIVSLRAFDGRLFAVYLERLPASLHRGANSPFQPSDARIILRDISSALSYIHMQHIVHNDIKPANITYSPERGAVLIDFEMATSGTGDLARGGTPWYLPPEFVESSMNRGALGDVWGLGVTLLYVLGKIGLPEKTVEAWLIYEVADKKKKEARGKMVSWLDSVAAKRQKLDCTDRVQELVHRMLENEPESRVRAEQVSAAFDSDSG